MSPSPLSTFEHTAIPVEPGGGPFALAEAEAEHLTLIGAALPGFCERGYRSVRLSQYCGLVNLGGRLIEILPKVGEHPDALQGRGVLLRMLRVASDLPLHRQDAAAQSDRNAPLLEIFIRAFFEELLVLLKGGLLRRYTECEDDLLAVRGTIRLQRQFSTLANRTDYVACRYDELTADNPWNRFLKAGLNAVRPWIQSLALQRIWFELSPAFEDISDIPHPRAMLKDLRYDRQAARYRPAVAWVERILNLLSPDLRSGNNPAPGLLFDMNRLFERVVEQRMGQWASERGWSLAAQDQSFLFAEINDAQRRPMYRLRPDLVFRSHGRVTFIADSKWKRPALSSHHYVVPDLADIYQLHAYATASRCNTLALIYPLDPHTVAKAKNTVLRLTSSAASSPRLVAGFVDITHDQFELSDSLRGIPNLL